MPLPSLLTYLITYLLTFSLTYLLPYLLTHSIAQSPSWEANWFAASQEIPRISRNPKVHYALTSVRHVSLSWASPIQSIYPHMPPPGIRHNTIHPSMPRSPQWSPSLRFPQQDAVHPLSSPKRATCPAHLYIPLPSNKAVLNKYIRSTLVSLWTQRGWRTLWSSIDRRISEWESVWIKTDRPYSI